MKTLKNQTLLYDEDCPLCRVYTSGFIQAGMLDENGKKPYCQLTLEEQNFIDIQRASNEIALVDNENKTVIYGIDSLLKVIGFSFPWMEKIGNILPIKFFLKKLYSLISYNRKVIIPSKINKNIKFQCVPDFSFKYRILFISIIILASSSFIYLYNPTYLYFEIIGFQLLLLILQSLILLRFSKEIVLNYFGNFVVSIFCGALLLIPMILLKLYIFIPSFTSNMYALFILALILIDVYRRIIIIKYNLLKT